MKILVLIISMELLSFPVAMMPPPTKMKNMINGPDSESQ
jgi:hypothetical protein